MGRKKDNWNLGWFFYHKAGEGDGCPPDPAGSGLTPGYRPVKLPHDWSLEYPFDEKAASCGSGGYVETGIGWYKKIFTVTEEEVRGKHLFLCFDGAYMKTRVWLNGSRIKEHIYGYTPFSVEITELVKTGRGECNVLDVEIDNSGQPGSRWYSGSGITRDVWILTVENSYVAENGVYIRQKKVTRQYAELMITTFCRNQEELTVKTSIISPRGTIAAEKETVAAPGNAVCTQLFSLEDPCLWSVASPCLYEVITRLYNKEGVLMDEVHTRTGLRSAVFDKDRGFLLNGEQVKINGVCIHHDGGCMGAAVPLQIWKRRLEKLKEMGANSIRMSHNPPDPGLLELCDEMGFLVMDEAFDEWKILKGKELGSNTHESRGYSEWFAQCHEEDLKAMLYRDRNHPSVVIWSIGNEVPDQTDPAGYLTARRLKEICKQLDPERAVTQANDQICAEPKAATQEFLNELDVVGYNYVGRWRTRSETLYEDDKRAHPDWCVIGTENPGMGGIRGEYDRGRETGSWWKRPYYSTPVAVGKLLRYTMTHDYVAGDFMWTGIDYLGEAHWPYRSASAGVLDTCGFEKDGYYFYQSIWRRDIPMVHLLPHWNLEVEEGTILPVLGFTSCESAELFLNGKSYGRKAYSYPAYGMTQRYGHYDKEPGAVNTEDLFLCWDVPYEPGCIELAGFVDGKEVCRHQVKNAGEPAALRVSCYQKEAAADGLDVGQIEVEILDKDGNFCWQADNELTFSAEGPGEVIGVDNGRPDSLESMKADHIHAFHGRALAVLRSDGNAGKCVLTVSAAGLPSAAAEVIFVTLR